MTGDDFTPDFWRRMRCPICEQPIAGPGSRGFCAQHFQEYEQRQRRGVSLFELDSRWQDTLAILKHKPSELANEPSQEEFSFDGPWPGTSWLLFTRGYVELRLPDWIAYNAVTNEVKRFVAVSSDDVMEDLLGGNPAPGQEQRDQLWGKPGPEPDSVTRMRHIAEETQAGTFRPPGIVNVMSQLGFPVYGIVDDFMDFALSSFGYGGGMHGFEHADLTFRTPADETKEATALVCVETGIRRYKVVRQEPEINRWEVKSAAEQAVRQFHAKIQPPPKDQRRVELRLKPRAGSPPFDRLGEPNSSAAQFRIESFPEATVFRWHSEPGVFGAIAQNDSTRLVLGMAGLSARQVVELAAHIGRVSDRPDVLLRYQEQTDARIRRLFGDI